MKNLSGMPFSPRSFVGMVLSWQCYVTTWIFALAGAAARAEPTFIPFLNPISVGAGNTVTCLVVAKRKLTAANVATGIFYLFGVWTFE